MKHVACVLTVVLALVFAASPVWPKDLCIASQAGASLLFIKNFRVPSRNNCKPLNGWIPTGIAAGAGCTTPNGQVLRIHVTEHDADADFVDSWACSFELPALTPGNCRRMVFAPGFSPTSVFFPSSTAHYCTGNNVP